MSFLGDTGHIIASANEEEVLLVERYDADGKTKKGFEGFDYEAIHPNKPVFHIMKRSGRTPPVTLIFTHSEVGTDARERRLRDWKRFLSNSDDDLNETFTLSLIHI